MVEPSFVYTTEGVAPYDPAGGMAALRSLVAQYYRGDLPAQAAAMSTFLNFREKTGVYFSDPVTPEYIKKGADEFWRQAQSYKLPGAELFRKLVNGFAGQGEAERMNKSVKHTRTIKRNRQSHVITSALVELKTFFRMEHEKEARGRGKREKPSYLLEVKQHFADFVEAEEERLLEEAIAEAEAALDPVPADEMEYADELETTADRVILSLLAQERVDEEEWQEMMDEGDGDTASV